MQSVKQFSSYLEIKSKLKNYNVNVIDSLTSIVEIMKLDNVITFIDSNVYNLYEEFQNMSSNLVIVKANEDFKSHENLELIIDNLISFDANSNTTLLAIGGGVVQDMIGYVASIWNRGIDYILVPTTVLAQIDSCIGGKTSINYRNKKNIIGTFYPPLTILIYHDFVKTLSPIDYWSGFGEYLKYCILDNNRSYDSHNKSIPSIIGTDLSVNDLTNGIICGMIIRAGLAYKADIINQDEFDKGERKLLNFGHTFGHALETVSSYAIPHGIGVMFGSLIALYISKQQYGGDGYETEQIFSKVRNIVVGINYKCGFTKDNNKIKEEWFDYEKLSQAIKADKKQTGSKQLRMVLLSKDGPVVDYVKNIEYVKQALEWMKNEVI